MKQVKFRWLPVITAVVLLVIAWGVPVLGQSLPNVNVVIMSGPEADGMKQVAAAYTEKTGNPVTIVEQGRDTYLTQIGRAHV